MPGATGDVPPGLPGQPGEKRAPTLGDLFWVGTACAISIVGAGAIGYGIDDAAGTLPWFTIAGPAFGVLSAVLLAVNQLRKYV
ncbi:MAG: AtpZ/AtpI family protein [Acidimicrobiales bacterium]